MIRVMSHAKGADVLLDKFRIDIIFFNQTVDLRPKVIIFVFD